MWSVQQQIYQVQALQSLCLNPQKRAVPCSRLLRDPHQEIQHQEQVCQLNQLQKKAPKLNKQQENSHLRSPVQTKRVKVKLLLDQVQNQDRHLKLQFLLEAAQVVREHFLRVVSLDGLRCRRNVINWKQPHLGRTGTMQVQIAKKKKAKLASIENACEQQTVA